MRVLVLFLRHGTEKYPDALAQLDRIYRTQASNLIRHTTVIDNALPAGASENQENCKVIGGNNVDWEFSGWQHALELLRGEVKRFDAVHFVTAAFRRLYTGYLDRFSPKVVEIVSQRPMCTGHIDYYPHPVRFGTFISRHWMRTSFWLINPSELIRLGRLASIADNRELFSTQDGWPFNRNGPLSPGYQELIVNWLTCDQGTGQGTAWHSRIDLTEVHGRNLFQQKARAIINEHLLSVRLRAQGTQLLDMTYLAELTDAGKTLPAPCPTWREQIRLRGIPGHDYIENAVVR